MNLNITCILPLISISGSGRSQVVGVKKKKKKRTKKKKKKKNPEKKGTSDTEIRHNLR